MDQNKQDFQALATAAALIAMGLEDGEDRNRVLAVGLCWPYYIRMLDQSHAGAMAALQAAHGEGQIIRRDEDALRAHFAAGHEAFGVFHKGRLVAQSLIRNENVAPAAHGWLAQRFTRVSTMGGVVVAPEARGQGLLDTMIGLWRERAAAQGTDLLHARVRPENERSWMVFMRNGLSITARQPSPEEPDHDVFMLYAPLTGAFADCAAANSTEEPQANINGLLADGYVATAWNARQRKFTLTRAAAP